MFNIQRRISITLVFLSLSGYVFSQNAEPSQDHLFFASIASGRAGEMAFQSLFRVSNQSAQTASGQIQFVASDSGRFPEPVTRWIGTPGSFESGGTSVQFDVPPESFLEVTLPFSEGGLAVGWASARAERGLEIQAFFQMARLNEEDPFDFRNALEQEVEILATHGVSRFSIPASLFIGDQSMNTALSLVNLALIPSEVTFSLNMGAEGDSVSRTLQGEEMISAFFDQIFTLVLPAIFPAELNAVLTVESEQPLAVTAFRTLAGLPLSPLVPRLELPAQEEVPVTPGQEFTLAFGQVAVVQEPALTLEFVEVTHDSRCPIDVVCIDAGEARILLRLRQGEAISEVTLATRGEMREVQVAGLVLELLEVEPAPISTRRIPLSEYRIRLSLRTE